MGIKQYSIIKKDTKILPDILITIFVFFILLIIIFNPDKYGKVFIEGLVLFYSSVLPGLFPFMFFTRILSSLMTIRLMTNKSEKLMNKVFKSPGIAGYVLLMSNISGYPIGAKLVGELHSNNIINENQAKKIITYTMTSGPIFIIGSVGSMMLHSIRAGILILLSHLLSNIFTGIILTRLGKQKDYTPNKSTTIAKKQYISMDRILTESMYSSVQSIMLVGGFISIFYCVSEILLNFNIIQFVSYPLYKILSLIGINPQISWGVMSGIIEVTRGIKELSTHFLEYPIMITSLCSSLISFSGLSIIIQSKAFLSETKIKTHFLIFSKSVHAILCFIICLLLSLIFF